VFGAAKLAKKANQKHAETNTYNSSVKIHSSVSTIFIFNQTDANLYQKSRGVSIIKKSKIINL